MQNIAATINRREKVGKFACLSCIYNKTDLTLSFMTFKEKWLLVIANFCGQTVWI
jgi:hypothetical protein